MHAFTHILADLERIFGLYEVVQLPVIVGVLILASARPGFGENLFKRIEDAITRIAERPILAAGSIFAFVIVGRLLLLPFIGTTRQIVPDDGSLLLQASTLAAGRLANPMLPPSFESIYVISNPSYASMYPVLRALPFAFGQVVGIGFWGGLLVCVAALCALVYWALKAWIPARYAYVAAMIAALRFGFFSFWINMYYGPAFTALGGVLLLAAYALVRRRPTVLNGALLGLGVFILMTTRPFEGMLFAAPIGVALIVDFFRAAAADKRAFFIAGAMAGVFVVAGLGLTVTANQAVTGDWKGQPYDLYRKTSASVPAFFVSARTDESSSKVRYSQIRANLRLEDPAYERGHSPRRLAVAEAHRLESYWLFYIGFALLIPLGVGLYAMRRNVVPLASLGVLFAGLSLVTWDHSQYASPAFGVLLLCVASGFMALRHWSPRGRPVGLAISRYLPLALIVGLVPALSNTFTGRPALKTGVDQLADNACCWIRPPSLHDQLDEALAKASEGQIVVVDSGPRAAARPVAVINRADVARQKVIWINDDPVYNAQIFAQYPGRRHWWLGWMDDGTPCLRAYDAQFPGQPHDERPGGSCETSAVLAAAR